MQCRVISLCVPTSSCSAEQYEEVLEELEKKVLDGCKQKGRHASAAKTDHLGVCLHLRSEAKLLPKDLDQSHTPGDGRC